MEEKYEVQETSGLELEIEPLSEEDLEDLEGVSGGSCSFAYCSNINDV